MKRRDPKTGAVTERWSVDVDFELADGNIGRVVAGEDVGTIIETR
jgi:hypothetical protein